MSGGSIQSALDTRLQAMGSLPDVAWPGVKYTPVVGTPYLAPSISALSQRPASAGITGVIRWDGSYTVMVNWSSLTAEGTAGAHAIADAVRANFMRGLWLSTSDNWHIVVGNTTIRPPIVQMPWIQIPVVSTFWADEYS